MRKIGFSCEEIENMDIRQINHILNYENECKRVDKILNKLNFAEAINYAYVGSQPKPKNKENKGARQYYSWIRKNIRDAFPEYKPTWSVWDNFPKGKRRKKVKIN